MATKRFFKEYRRKEKTDYNKRLSLLKSNKLRLVVRFSRKNIIAQIVEYIPSGDKILFTASSKDLEKKGWKVSKTNLPATYLVGLILAKKASGNVKEVILDIGQKKSVAHSKVYALVKGVVDGGVNIPVDEQMFPEEDRMKGQHIKNYAELLAKEDKERYEKIFSLYLKKSVKPEDLPNHFEEIKSKI